MEQQDRGQQILRDAVQLALDHPGRQLGAGGRARQQGGGEPVFFQRQAGRERLGRGRHAVQPRDFDQTVQEGVFVRGAGVRAPLPGGQFR